MNLAKEMESQYQLKAISHRSANADSTAGAVQNLLLSDPLVKGRKAQHNNDDNLILVKIIQNNSGEFVAHFEYQGHKFPVKIEEKLLGRSIRKITSEKVYMNSDLMLFLYDLNGKKLVKRKGRT